MIHSSCDVFPRGIHDDYRFLLIKRPGSLVLSETKFPCASRVVSNLSLVRPANWFWSSRITADSSLKPLVTDPITRFFPSRTYSFFSIAPSCPHSQYTKQNAETTTCRS